MIRTSEDNGKVPSRTALSVNGSLLVDRELDLVRAKISTKKCPMRFQQKNALCSLKFLHNMGKKIERTKEIIIDDSRS